MAEADGRLMGSKAAFTLSAFGDEIDPDLDVQLRLLNELDIGYLELRSAWGTNVLNVDDAQIASIKRICEGCSIGVSCIGSPIGKTPIETPIDRELENLERIFEVAQSLGTNRVRVFAFYPPGKGCGGDPKAYVSEAIDRLALMAHRAELRNMLLLLENDRGLVGDTPERCQAILMAVDSPHLRHVWDTANFVQVGVSRPTDRGWPMLGSYVDHVQVKDASLADGKECVAGQGDAQVPELLARLRESGYRGFLALEPHLVHSGHGTGFSGPDGMRRAVHALRRLMEDQSCAEVRAPFS